MTGPLSFDVFPRRKSFSLAWILQALVIGLKGRINAAPINISKIIIYDHEMACLTKTTPPSGLTRGLIEQYMIIFDRNY